eukprot:14766004-Alexandrium_andersonii.AAC.1
MPRLRASAKNGGAPRERAKIIVFEAKTFAVLRGAHFQKQKSRSEHVGVPGASPPESRPICAWFVCIFSGPPQMSFLERSLANVRVGRPQLPKQ